jgi:SAM-dependent methyltransferase
VPTPRTEQRFTFDEIAELYDRTRPRYPETLLDDLVSLSCIPAGGRILEIGCGTGQLSTALAARGYELVCLEPGPSLAQIARRRLGGSRAQVIGQTFESWPLERRAFDLVASAQAFHWVDPAIRFAKAADALRLGGCLAVIGNAAKRQESPIRLALDRAYAEHAPSLSAGGAQAGWYAEEALIRSLFDESRRFGPVHARHHPWSQRYRADDYVDLLRTHSDHNLLPDAQRESLLAAVREAVAQGGGSYEVAYDGHLYLARVAE